MDIGHRYSGRIPGFHLLPSSRILFQIGRIGHRPDGFNLARLSGKGQRRNGDKQEDCNYSGAHISLRITTVMHGM